MGRMTVQQGKELMENKDFGEFLSITREQLGLDKEKMADFLGYPLKKYEMVEKGKSRAYNMEWLEEYIMNVLKVVSVRKREGLSITPVIKSRHLGDRMVREYQQGYSLVKVAMRMGSVEIHPEVYLVERGIEIEQYDWEKELVEIPNQMGRWEEVMNRKGVV